MTASNHKKVFKQLKAKPVIFKKFIKHNAPKERSCGINLKRCIRCGRISNKITITKCFKCKTMGFI